MTLLSSLRRLLTVPSSRTAKRRPACRRPSSRPQLEALEDRTVPTAVAPPAGLVSWWTADNTAADLTGGNNATLYNGATYAAGMVGQAFSFDGVNARANVADASNLQFTASMSIEAWIKVNAYPSGPPADHGEIFFRGDDRGGLDPYSLSTEPNGTVDFQVTNQNNVSASLAAPIALGQFIHVAATLDDATGTMRLYENGVIVAQQATTIRPFQNLDPASNPGIGIGNHGGYPATPHNFPFSGLIDELSAYNRALTPGEVQGIYSAGSDGKIKSPNYFGADFPSVVDDGPAGSTAPVTFTISRVGNLSGQAVNWTTTDGTAKAGIDYVAASGQVVFQDGQSQATVQVAVNGDNTPEPNKTFQLVLSTTTPGYAAGMGQATILDDDTGISVNSVTVTEGNPHFGSLGALVDRAADGGLNLATGMVFGPDGNLYVGSFNTNEVLRYSAATGAFLGAFVTSGSGGLTTPAQEGLIFRPDGKLYVASRDNSNVSRYDATTGAFLDTFVPSNSGGLLSAKGMIFGPDGNLYISSAGTNQVLRYNGTTGAFLGVFVAAGSGGLSIPRSLTFGPDGNLYVSSGGTGSVLRYNGTTGALLGAFIPTNLGGLANPAGLLFTNGSLYVADQVNNQILRYDATTGAFMEAAAPPNSNGLNSPIGLLLDANNNLLVGSNSEILRYGPASQAAFTVSLSSASSSPVTVDYSTANGTAVAGADFVAVSGTLTFAPGETTKTVVVPTLNDSVAEGDKTFTLNLANPSGATITAGQGVGTIHEDDATKFYVVNDGSSLDQTYKYNSVDSYLGNSTLNSSDTAPRGAAATAAGTTVWVVDANKKVYVYNPGGALLGSWSAGGLSSSAQLTGIATNGADVWLVDSYTDKVYKFTGAASRRSGSQNAGSSFRLNSADANPQDIVTDGTSFWVVDGSRLQVFKYTLSGSSLGSWTIDPANTHPTGLTINPTNVSDIWIVDNGTERVYQYIGAAGRTSGSQNAAATFALAPGDTNPQGIADPPPPYMLLTPAASSLALKQPSVTDKLLGGNVRELMVGGSGASTLSGGGGATLATALLSSGESVVFTGGGTDGIVGTTHDSANTLSAFMPGDVAPALGLHPFLGDFAAHPNAADGAAEWSPADLAFLPPLDALLPTGQFR